ncbi:MAG: family 10 glycosylhydrolase, partial [Kiritimatiellia bacterium]|nr:family 10 glycosylhydrolase [Kiritimatiellia bacterium]
FANLMWAGLAHYASDTLPRSDTFRLYGDQLEKVTAAGHRNGVQVHIWAVLWNLTAAPASYIEKARSEGRLLMDADGKTLPWLCPAHPENRAQTLAALREIARLQPIDGLHLDYIRYPVNEFVYGSTTRADFEKRIGRKVPRWPADVRPGGPLRGDYEKWRAEVITSFVREVRAMLRQNRPDAKLSAAVFGGYPDCITSIGQDWGSWLKDGLVDFVAPMNYTDNLSRFTTLLNTQIRLTGARDRIVPGIGVEADESSLTADLVIEQIAAARRLGVESFVLFDLNPELRDRILPMLRLGLTRPRN